MVSDNYQCDKVYILLGRVPVRGSLDQVGLWTCLWEFVLIVFMEVGRPSLNWVPPIPRFESLKVSKEQSQLGASVCIQSSARRLQVSTASVYLQ